MAAPSVHRPDPHATKDWPRPGRSFRALLLGEVVNKGARFAAAAALARSLSLDDFGLVNVGIAAGGLLLMGTTLGLPEVGARDVAVRADLARRLAHRVVGMRTLVVAGAGLLGLAVVAVVDSGALPFAALAVGMALVPSASLEWLLRGLDRMSARAVATAIGGIAVLVGAVVIVPIAPTPVLGLAVFVVGEAVTAVLTWRAARLGGQPSSAISDVRTLLRRSWPVAISAFVVYSYYANFDTILLSVTRSNEEAGLYSAPYRVFLALNTVAIFAAYAFLPVLARGVAEGRMEEAMARLRRSFAPLCGYGFLVLGIAEVAGSELLGVLFGDRFESMRVVFILLCLAIPWYVIGYPVGYGLIARDENRRFLLGAGVAGGLNVVLNVALIPPFGPEGAAVATVVALAAGTIVWLRLHWLLDARVAPILAALAATSAGAVLASAYRDTGAAVGAMTLAIGLVLTTPYLLRRTRARLS